MTARKTKTANADAERHFRKTYPQSTIQKQLGADWQKLHPSVRQRFAQDPAEGEHIFYRGVMEQIECSRAGRLFAWLTRLVGNPLTPYRGHFIKMDVILHKRPGKSGVYWQRTYYYPERAPYTVTSVKREGRKGEMLECVGGGFGMVLDVTAENGELHFRSTRYFWQLGRLRVPLPHWLSPGVTHVVHTDLGDGRFRFTIRMIHRQLGQTFYQTGVFKGE